MTHHEFIKIIGDYFNLGSLKNHDFYPWFFFHQKSEIDVEQFLIFPMEISRSADPDPKATRWCR